MFLLPTIHCLCLSTHFLKLRVLYCTQIWAWIDRNGLVMCKFMWRCQIMIIKWCRHNPSSDVLGTILTSFHHDSFLPMNFIHDIIKLFILVLCVDRLKWQKHGISCLLLGFYSDTLWQVLAILSQSCCWTMDWLKGHLRISRYKRTSQQNNLKPSSAWATIQMT